MHVMGGCPPSGFINTPCSSHGLPGWGITCVCSVSCVGNSDAEDSSSRGRTGIRRRLLAYSASAPMVRQRRRMLRGNNANSVRGNGSAIPLQRFAPVGRGQISQLQFRRAAPLHGMKMSLAAVRYSTEVAMRLHSSRARSLHAGLRCAKRSTSRSHNQSEQRHHTGNPCQPSFVSQWHGTSHQVVSKLRSPHAWRQLACLCGRAEPARRPQSL